MNNNIFSSGFSISDRLVKLVSRIIRLIGNGPVFDSAARRHLH